jgi:hypothetical protein
VYAKTAAAYDWIIAGSCALSSEPAALCSDLGVTFPPIPSPAPTPLTPHPTVAPPLARIDIIVQYDRFPSQTNFFIATQDGIPLATRPSTPLPSFARVVYTYPQVPYGLYQFVVVDDDGLSAGPTTGFVEIYQIGPNSDGSSSFSVLIGLGSHDFNASTTILFNVTDDPLSNEVTRPTAAPTIQPTHQPTTPTTPRPTRPTVVDGTKSPTTEQPPSVSAQRPSGTNGDDDNGTINDDGTTENELFGIDLNDTTSLIILGAAVLAALILICFLVRCLCCSKTTSSHAGRRDEFLPP